jgi:hypothetical protein
MVWATFALVVGAGPWMLGCAAGQGEALRHLPEGMSHVDAASLGLRPGDTSVDEARRAMSRSNLSGITADSMVTDDGVRFDALAADFQQEVHFFVDGTYRESVRLRSRGIPPYGLAVRLAVSRGRIKLLVLYRDPLETVDVRSVLAAPPRIDVFILSPEGLAHSGTRTLRSHAARHGGLTAPLFVGRDLDDGLMLVARGRSGRVWRRALFLGCRRRASGWRLVVVRTVPISEAARCSCVEGYLSGS